MWLRTEEMKVDDLEGIEVRSDGRTVWVNGKQGCVARFCPVSHEVWTNGVEHVTNHPDIKPDFSHWKSFRKLVFDNYSIVINNKHIPLYLIPN